MFRFGVGGTTTAIIIIVKPRGVCGARYDTLTVRPTKRDCATGYKSAARNPRKDASKSIHLIDKITRL